jgi:hypothetical protein
MPTLITRRWSLTGGEHNGWGFCYCCGEHAKGGGDFCSNLCAQTYHEVIPYSEEQLPVAHFEHDCRVCKFLGGFEEYDLYIHRKPNGTRSNTSLIARFGNSEYDYISTLVPEAFDGDPEAYYRQADPWYRVLICRVQAFRLL